MRAKTRRSLPSRVTALGFIFVVFFGNFWLSYRLVGAGDPTWLRVGFFLGVGAVAVGGAGLLALGVRNYLWPGDPEPDDENPNQRDEGSS